eukprot:scaffold5956_cov124-Pinguiococcus_pyrenoidosus.AAC.1
MLPHALLVPAEQLQAPLGAAREPLEDELSRQRPELLFRSVVHQALPELLLVRPSLAFLLVAEPHCSGQALQLQ